MLSVSTPPAIVVYADSPVRTHAQRRYRRLMLELERTDNLRKKLERQKQEQFDKTHCSFCRRPEIVSRNLRLCGECTQAHLEEQRRQQVIERKETLPLDPAEGRKALESYGVTLGCPLCGSPIPRGHIACQRHLTIALLRLMQGRPVV